MKLGFVIANMDRFGAEATIYAARPWTADSIAAVEVEPEEDGFPPEIRERGLTYFLEIHLARDVRDGWLSSLDQVPSSAELCARIIGYAIDDA